jgi:hypothetical protein
MRTRRGKLQVFPTKKSTTIKSQPCMCVNHYCIVVLLYLLYHQRVGVRLGVQVALVNTFRQRTYGCTHAQALWSLDVQYSYLYATLASRA